MEIKFTDEMKAGMLKAMAGDDAFRLNNRRLEMEHAQDWRGIQDQIPYLQFDPDWEVKIIPPFGGAMARFVARKGDNTGVSIYLDFSDALGCVGEPYWEVYPYGEDGPVRCLLNETDQLMSYIREELERQGSVGAQSD